MANRKKHRAKIHLRRSTDRQEKSLAQQLDWALAKAAENGLVSEASQQMLTYMLEKGQPKYGDLYVDDAISGSDLLRPGLSALRKDAIADPNTSHVLIYLPDRFARPEEPLEAALMEIKLCKAGLTVVFSNRVALPRQHGVNYFAENVQLLYNYTEAGEYLNLLAQRVIEGQLKSAQAGCWTGGRAPYGHARVLVDAHGQIIQELADGMRIRMEGCRVRIKAKDLEKIKVWLMILELYFLRKLGSKKIARQLNTLQIPSPDAGRYRKDRGVQH